jgi:hypothetical protein
MAMTFPAGSYEYVPPPNVAGPLSGDGWKFCAADEIAARRRTAAKTARDRIISTRSTVR